MRRLLLLLIAVATVACKAPTRYGALGAGAIPVPLPVIIQSDGGSSAEPIVFAPAVAPATYIDAGTGVLTGDTGATWLTGGAFAVPSGAKQVTWVITYNGGGTTSQLSYRIRVGHTSGAMGVSRIRNSSPSISGSVANQSEYSNTITLAETGTATVTIPVPYDVSGGYQFVALDLQEAVVSVTDAGLATVTIAAGFN